LTVRYPYSAGWFFTRLTQYGTSRRVDATELVVDRRGERHDHLEAAALGGVQVVDGVVRPGRALHDDVEAAVADPAVVRGNVGQGDVLQDHRHRVALGGDDSACAEQRAAITASRARLAGRWTDRVRRLMRFMR
jgi:hypothetical protein